MSHPWQQHPWQQYPWQQYPWQTFCGQKHPSQQQIPAASIRVQPSPTVVNHHTTQKIKIHTPSQTLCAANSKSEDVEKALLTSEVEFLQKQLTEQQCKSDDNPREQNVHRHVCVICLDSEVNSVLIPCGHVSSCMNCVHSLHSCPICRTPVQSFQKVYLS